MTYQEKENLAGEVAVEFYNLLWGANVTPEAAAATPKGPSQIAIALGLAMRKVFDRRL